MEKITEKPKETMMKYSVRLRQNMWKEIERQRVRLQLKDNSECVRMALVLGLSQLREKK